MKIVFLGNHTVGVESLSVILNSNVDVAGVVAHPLDHNDGVVYKSVYDYAIEKNIPALRGKATDSKTLEFINQKSPDLIWVVDYKYLLPNAVLNAARLGAINLHPSLLPEYRGRAPVNWAIINGETELGLTAHFIDDGVDSGDILVQKKYMLANTEDINDALEKLYPLYRNITSEIFGLLKKDKIIRIKQCITDSTLYPARKPEDGLIDWNMPAKSILNLIRAVAKPYPGAFSYYYDTKIIIWKASVITEKINSPVGTIIYFKKDKPVISCVNSSLLIDEYEVTNNKAVKLNKGEMFLSNG